MTASDDPFAEAERLETYALHKKASKDKSSDEFDKVNLFQVDTFHYFFIFYMQSQLTDTLSQHIQTMYQQFHFFINTYIISRLLPPPPLPPAISLFTLSYHSLICTCTVSAQKQTGRPYGAMLKGERDMQNLPARHVGFGHMERTSPRFNSPDRESWQEHQDHHRRQRMADGQSQW